MNNVRDATLANEAHNQLSFVPNNRYPLVFLRQIVEDLIIVIFTLLPKL
jgi:hypothetical protein